MMSISIPTSFVQNIFCPIHSYLDVLHVYMYSLTHNDA
jgi:hypothetical protein